MSTRLLFKIGWGWAMPRDFNDDPRKQQELAARPAVERAIRDAYAKYDLLVTDVCWLPDKKEWEYLDRGFGLDGWYYIRDGNEGKGMRFTFQAKALSRKYASYASLTVELYNNPVTREPGDYFNCAAQTYICGYLTHDNAALFPWALVDYFALKMAALRGEIAWKQNSNKHDGAQANFRYIEIAKLPNDLVIARAA